MIDSDNLDTPQIGKKVGKEIYTFPVSINLHLKQFSRYPCILHLTEYTTYFIKL